jgi:putative PEP-CTERM system histidine kinase
MAAAGYYLRYVGGNWGTVMEAAFLFGAVLLLAAVMFSGSARSVLKVFISKNFFSYSYDYREEWLRFTHTLSENGPELRERTIQGIAELVESPGGTLYLKREGNCFEPVANWNMSLAREAEPTEGPFCQFLEHRKWVIDLREFNSHPQRYGAMLLPEWLRNSTKARLVVPLNLHGSLFGFVVLAHPRSTFQLNWEILDLLKIAGRQAASYIAQQEASNALFVARQFESFNRMSTFVVHDLKNLVSQLSLLLSNAEKHKGNPEFQADMVDTVDHSVRKMKLLLEKLSRGSEMEQPAPLLIDDLLQQAVAAKSHAEPKPVLEIKDCGLVVLADFARLERVIGHIIQNAIEATARDGQVVIRLAKQNDSVVVELEDTGQGMSEEFIRERLFKPFESTKSGGMGIGVFESRAYIRELGGQIKVFSRQSVGTTFRLILPLFDYEAQVAKRFG